MSLRLQIKSSLPAGSVHLYEADFHVLEFRQVLRHGRHNVNLAFFHQHHDGDARDRLGHGENAKHGVGFHGTFFLAVLIADRLPVNDLAIAPDNQYGARNGGFVHLGLEKLRNAREAFSGESSFFGAAEPGKLLAERTHRAQYKSNYGRTSFSSHRGSLHNWRNESL